MAQSELEMEKQLVEQLANSGYEVLEATNESSIVENFRQRTGTGAIAQRHHFRQVDAFTSARDGQPFRRHRGQS